MNNFLHILYIFFCIVQFLSGVLLIGVVVIQESKNEGLTGQIGTTATSSFKGKAGKEEMLTALTIRVASVFFVISLLVAYGTGRW